MLDHGDLIYGYFPPLLASSVTAAPRSSSKSLTMEDSHTLPFDTHDHEQSSLGRVHPSDSHSDGRSVKRLRTSRTASIPGEQDKEENFEIRQHKPHTRVVTACKACRARKTKCDGRRPTCVFCSKREVICEYDEVNLQLTGCQTLGPQILDAIGNLAELIRQQQVQHSPLNHLNGFGSTPSPHDSNGRPIDRRGSQYCQLGHCCLHSASPQTANLIAESPNSSREKDLQVATFTEGLDSILKWNIFPPGLQKIPVHDEGIVQMSHILPRIDYDEMVRLEARYISVVHTKNPMLDLRDLRKKISEVSENGLDWSTSTCLVALVCAIGSLCRGYGSGNSAIVDDSTIERDIETAARFWSIASKRLGLAIGENTLEAVQCVSLAGIWYICNFQPLQAWKYFTMAGNSWYFATLTRSSIIRVDDDAHSSKSIEQSTFFTSYKTELEIRFELGIKGSILDHLDYPYTFPLPPNFDTEEGSNSALEKERVGWYYYLSEIAARHLLNRLVRTRLTAKTEPSARELQVMLTDLQIYETQLHEWYSSLPPRISFDLPNDSLTPYQDEFQQILRSRYMFIRDLCYRPFIQVCLNNTLEIPHELMLKIAAVASQGLQNCAWRLQSMSSYRTHNPGIWFMIRVATSCSMVLIAAVRAQHNVLLNAASYLKIPPDWRQQIQRVLHILSPFEHETRGGIMECIQMVKWALDNLVT